MLNLRTSIGGLRNKVGNLESKFDRLRDQTVSDLNNISKRVARIEKQIWDITNRPEKRNLDVSHLPESETCAAVKYVG